MAKKDGRRYTAKFKFQVILEAQRSQKPDADTFAFKSLENRRLLFIADPSSVGGIHLKQLSDFPEPAHLEPHGSFDNFEQVACHHNAIKGGLEVHVDIPVRARVLVVAERAGDVIAESLSFRSGQRYIGQGPLIWMKSFSDEFYSNVFGVCVGLFPYVRFNSLERL